MNEITVNEITHETERDEPQRRVRDVHPAGLPGIEARFGYEESGRIVLPRDWDNVSN